MSKAFASVPSAEAALEKLARVTAARKQRDAYAGDSPQARKGVKWSLVTHRSTESPPADALCPPPAGEDAPTLPSISAAPTSPPTAVTPAAAAAAAATGVTTFDAKADAVRLAVPTPEPPSAAPSAGRPLSGGRRGRSRGRANLAVRLPTSVLGATGLPCSPVAVPASGAAAAAPPGDAPPLRATVDLVPSPLSVRQPPSVQPTPVVDVFRQYDQVCYNPTGDPRKLSAIAAARVVQNLRDHEVAHTVAQRHELPAAVPVLDSKFHVHKAFAQLPFFNPLPGVHGMPSPVTVQPSPVADASTRRPLESPSDAAAVAALTAAIALKRSPTASAVATSGRSPSLRLRKHHSQRALRSSTFASQGRGSPPASPKPPSSMSPAGTARRLPQRPRFGRSNTAKALLPRRELASTMAPSPTRPRRSLLTPSSSRSSAASLPTLSPAASTAAVSPAASTAAVSPGACSQPEAVPAAACVSTPIEDAVGDATPGEAAGEAPVEPRRERPAEAPNAKTPAAASATASTPVVAQGPLSPLFRVHKPQPPPQQPRAVPPAVPTVTGDGPDAIRALLDSLALSAYAGPLLEMGYDTLDRFKLLEGEDLDCVAGLKKAHKKHLLAIVRAMCTATDGT